MRDLTALRVAIDPGILGWTTSALQRLEYTLELVFFQLGYAWRRCQSDGPPNGSVDVQVSTTGGPQLRTDQFTLLVEPSLWEKPSAVPATALGRDLLFEIFWWVSGVWEAQAQRDTHGRVEPQPELTNGRAEAFYLTCPATVALRKLRKLLERAGTPAEPLPLWPNGKKYAVALSHDVDYPEVVRWLEPLRILMRRGVREWRLAKSVASGSRHHWHFASWAEAETLLGSRSAFYFIPRQGSVAEYAVSRFGFGTPDSFYDISLTRFREVMKVLRDGGFEVGLQASYEAYKSKERFQRDVDRLVEAGGGPELGNRHHYWHMSPKDPNETLHIHEQCGLVYDTSLAFERLNGWRRGIATPFFPYYEGAGRALRVLQMQTVCMDDHFFGYASLNNNGGGPGARVKYLLRRAAELEGCLLADIHEYVFDQDLFPGWRETFQLLMREALADSDAYVALPGDIARWWRERTRQLREASGGLTVAGGACG